MKKTVAVLATLDTKGPEADYVRGEIEALGGAALLIDMGVVGEPGAKADVTREEVAAAGGGSLAAILKNPTRQEAAPVMVAGAAKILGERAAAGEVHAALGMGGTQGTANCAAVMRAMPYGFPKVMISTVASGDVGAFVGIKDVTMMFSVADILGLNPVTRKILANGAAAAWGMAQSRVTIELAGGPRKTVAMTNLGVLTEGAMTAMARFEEGGYEVIVFHAVGSGGRAMEQMMKEGLIGGVFDYALGEIADDLHGALRAGGAERLTVAGKLGLPQVLCPGGAEHIGLLLETPDVVPERWRGYQHVFHNPVILAPRLKPAELEEVGREIGRRLATTRGRAVMLFPARGTSRYAIEGGPLRDPEGDRAFRDALRGALPASVEFAERDAAAEDPAFVNEAVDRLIAMMEE